MPSKTDRSDLEDGEGSSFSYSRYAKAIEGALDKVPVKNGVVSIELVQLETSLPRDLIEELLDRGEVSFPDKVKEIRMED